MVPWWKKYFLQNVKDPLWSRAKQKEGTAKRSCCALAIQNSLALLRGAGTGVCSEGEKLSMKKGDNWNLDVCLSVPNYGDLL